jgi:hypothetical protein
MKIFFGMGIAFALILYLNSQPTKQIEKQEDSVRMLSNPEQPIQGERRFDILERESIDRKFNLVSIDTDREGNYFILDLIEKKVFKLGQDKMFQRIIEGEVFSESDQLIIDANGNIFVRDNKVLHIFFAKGQSYKRLRFPFYIGGYAVTRKNLLLVENSRFYSGTLRFRLELYDLNGHHIKTVFERDEKIMSSQHKSSTLFHPRLLVRQNEDHILFGFTGDYKLYLVGENGNIKSIITKEEKPMPVTRENLREMKMELNSTWAPKYKPFFHDIFIDEQGNIFVEKWPEGRPSLESRYFDYFNHEGKFLYVIRDLPHLVIAKIMRDRLIGVRPLKGSPYQQLLILRYTLTQ